MVEQAEQIELLADMADGMSDMDLFAGQEELGYKPDRLGADVASTHLLQTAQTTNQRTESTGRLDLKWPQQAFDTHRKTKLIRGELVECRIAGGGDATEADLRKKAQHRTKQKSKSSTKKSAKQAPKERKPPQRIKASTKRKEAPQRI
jgi:hypothetical protein